jgi:flagellar biogenesis protein FliO
VRAGFVGILALVVGTLAPLPANADTPNPAPKQWLAHPTAHPAPAASPSVSGGAVVRSCAALLLLAGLGAGALVMRKKRLENPTLGMTLKVDVLGSTRIGPKAHAVVVAVAGQRLLLGVTDATVQRLATLDDPLADYDPADDPEADEPPVRRQSANLFDDAPAKADTRQSRTRADDAAAKIEARFRSGDALSAGRTAKAEAPAIAKARRALAATNAKVEPHATASSFRDIFAKWSRPTKEKGLPTDSAAYAIAESTEDVFSASGRSGDTGRATPPGVPQRLTPPGVPQRLIEGQAKGLAARLQGKVA